MKTNDSDKRRGATVVLFAILLIVFVGMAAFIVDLGRMQLVRSQMQTAVDAGALAASLQLKKDPTNAAAAKTVAEDFIRLNQVGFVGLVPRDAITVQCGDWNAKTKTFSQLSSQPLAVRVHANQSNEPFFFAGVFGLNQFTIPRQSIAAVEGSPLDIMLVLDLSGSMADEGRIEALQDSAPVFIDVVESLSHDDRVGVMGYGAIRGLYNPVAQGHAGVVYELAPDSLYPNPASAHNDWAGVLESDLTENFDHLRGAVLADTSLIAGKYNNYTPTGAAIRDAAHYLWAHPRPDVEKQIVLMSDGFANRPHGDGPNYAVAMANYAASLKIRIDTISLGDTADLTLMQAIATATDGRHFDVTGSGAELATKLEKAFRDIANGLKRTQLVQ